MESNKEKIVEVIANLVEVRDNIFTQIVNLAMSGEMQSIEGSFDFGESYNFKLAHFEDVEDINVKKLVSLCKKSEETIFSIMNLNGITENEVEL